MKQGYKRHLATFLALFLAIIMGTGNLTPLIYAENNKPIKGFKVEIMYDKKPEKEDDLPVQGRDLLFSIRLENETKAQVEYLESINDENTKKSFNTESDPFITNLNQTIRFIDQKKIDSIDNDDKKQILTSLLLLLNLDIKDGPKILPKLEKNVETLGYNLKNRIFKRIFIDQKLDTCYIQFELQDKTSEGSENSNENSGSENQNEGSGSENQNEGSGSENQNEGSGSENQNEGSGSENSNQGGESGNSSPSPSQPDAGANNGNQNNTTVTENTAPADEYREYTGETNTVTIEDETTPLGELDKTPLGSIEEINKAYITGYNDGTLQPETKVTREVAATILHRLMDEKTLAELKGEGMKFSDMKETDWSYKYVEDLVKAGVFKGYTDGSFKPAMTISRAELAAVLARFYKIEESADHKFEDIRGHWAEKMIAGLVAKGYVSGYPDGSYMPGKEVTRAEMATIINKILARNVKKEELTKEFGDMSDVKMDKWYYTDMLLATLNYKSTRDENGQQKFGGVVDINNK